MATNLDELKAVSRVAIIKEMIERTKHCAFKWHEMAPAQYRATSLPYEFTLTKTNANTAVLDVRKEGRLWRSYNSSTLSDVMELYQTVDILYASTQAMAKAHGLTQFVAEIRGCQPRTYNIVMNGGIKGGGSAPNEKLSPVSLRLGPNALSFGPTPFPWTGGLSDISEVATSHDEDATCIRQQVSGALPTNWGYAIVGFDEFDVAGLRSPLSFNVRVAHRRETEDGVNLVTDVLVNNAVIYTNSTASGDTYSVTQSGSQLMVGIDQIDTLEVRVSMFTNTGNAAPRVLRVSAVDIEILGYIVS